MSNELLLRAVFAGNVVVAGTVGVLALCAPATATRFVFSQSPGQAALLQVIGAFWSAIALLSLGGLWRPWIFWPVLLLQLLYKGAWLLLAGLPWLAAGRPQPFPTGMAGFFALWVVVLPWIIPWSRLIRPG